MEQIAFPKPKFKKHRTEKVLQSTYNRVWTRDKGTCRLCGARFSLELHHVNRKRQEPNK